MPTNKNNQPTKYFLGLDVGSVSVKIALLNENGELVHHDWQRHFGRPFLKAAEVLTALVARFPLTNIAPPMVTGVGAAELAPLLSGEPMGEVMALTMASGHFCKPENGERGSTSVPATIIDIGGEDTKVLWLSANKGELLLADFTMNTMCAAGTGSFLDQQAHRLGYTIEEFSQLALKSEVPPRVAGRCSVFAKSDMIHLQQSATPDYEIIYGLCLAMARSIKSGLAQGKALPAPLLFVGGVAANVGLRKALGEILALAENEIIIPESHFVFAALGAAVGAWQKPSDASWSLEPLKDFLACEQKPPERLAPLKRRQQEPKLASFNWDDVTEPVDVYIGVDIGSVSTNLVLLSPQGRLLSRQYLPTAGRPLEAISQALANLSPAIKTYARVLGVGTTGSGRYLSADFLGADLTVNEITAQATAAVAIDPKVDTIFEIGGQDSKYISIKDGVIVDFMMNKACAAGTGSFLEEQAEKLGLKIVGEFGKAALASQNPVALGERCTVFMESDLVHHQQKGVNHQDLTAGLCYGIVANYLGRVVETRPIGEHIFFQGGTSFNQGVAAAFESWLSRPITVPDNADVTGAMGAALIARDRRTWEQSSFKGFELSTKSYKITSFECKSCENRCEIRQVSVASGARFYYGSRCGKFEETQSGSKKQSQWPDLFDYRAQMAFDSPEVAACLARKNRTARPRIGLMRSMFLAELGPFWAMFWAHLGFEPLWSSPTNKTIIHQGCERVGSEFCFPIKAAHGHLLDLVAQKPDYIFLPSVVNMPPGEMESEAQAPDNAACPYVQSLAYTAPAALGLAPENLITGPVFFGEGPKVLERSLWQLTRQFKFSKKEVHGALKEALAAQKAFQSRLLAKGKELLDGLQPDEQAMVVVGRPYNAFDPGLNLRLSQKLADLGILGLPMDFLPLDKASVEAPHHYWRYGQKITAAGELIARDPRLQALYISNFACGPDSFIIHFFKNQMAGKPFLEIEIDEHSSDVGAVTRLEAFLDSLAARKARAQQSEEKSRPAPLTLLRFPKRTQTIYLPPMCDHSQSFAAAWRGAGFETESLPVSDRETVALGRAHSSGKECYPLVLTVGDFVKLTKRPGFDPAKSAIFMPSANGPCRFGQYSRYLKLVMHRLGLDEVSVIALDQHSNMYSAVDRAKTTENISLTLWKALVSVDFLQKALRQTKPRELRSGTAQTAYDAALKDVVATLETGSDLAPAFARAKESFAAITDRHIGPADKPKVGVVGEIYVRQNQFANEDIINRLEALGAEVTIPPFAEWLFYVNYVNSMRAARKKAWGSYFKHQALSFIQNRELKKMARPWGDFFHHGALEPPLRTLLPLGEKFLHRSFQGEAILSLGKGVEYFHHQASGLVNVMPFTCMPGLVVKGLISDFRETCGQMPALNLSFDGQSQTNTQARLEAFMYQVKAFHGQRVNGQGRPDGH